MSKPSKKLSSSTKHYKLTLKQEKFCIEYIETGNASEAYRRAYSTSKMKESTINRKAKYTIDLGKIKARVNALMAPVYEKLEVTQEKTLKRLMQGQEFDIRELYDENGKLKKPCDLDENVAKAVVGVKYDKDGALLEYKIIDVKGCAELVGRHMALFTDNHVYKGDKDNPVVIQDYDSLSTQEKLRILNERIGRGKTK